MTILTAVSCTAPTAIFSTSPHYLQMIRGIAGLESIQKIAIPLLKAGSSLYLSSFGALEIFHSIQKTTPTEASMITAIGKQRLSPSATFLGEHGKLMMGSGCFHLLDMLQSLGVVNCGKAANLISSAGSLLFLCANVYALDENIRLYQEIEGTDWTKTNIDQEELRWLKHSSFWGTMSNIGYIIATATLLFSEATAMTLIIALLSCFAGGMKILCDFYRYKVSTRQEKLINL